MLCSFMSKPHKLTMGKEWFDSTTIQKKGVNLLSNNAVRKSPHEGEWKVQCNI